MDVFGKVTALIMSMILFFGWPLAYFRMKQEELADSHIFYETVRFVDQVQETGSVTEELYSCYLERLAVSGKAVQVEMEEEGDWLTVTVSNGLIYGGKIKNEDD